MTLDEIREKYSTPGLRSNTLSRTSKRFHLETDPRTRDPKIVKDTLEELYGPDPMPALPVVESFDLDAVIDRALAKRMGVVTATRVLPPSTGFVRAPVAPPSPVTVKVATIGFLAGGIASVNIGPPPAPSGNVCAECGSANLIRAGTCETCRDCGWNPGCG